MVSERTKAHLVMALCVGFLGSLALGLLVFLFWLVGFGWFAGAFLIGLATFFALMGIEWAMGKLG